VGGRAPGGDLAVDHPDDGDVGGRVTATDAQHVADRHVAALRRVDVGGRLVVLREEPTGSIA
jgi:hypothetical protein